MADLTFSIGATKVVLRVDLRLLAQLVVLAHRVEDAFEHHAVAGVEVGAEARVEVGDDERELLDRRLDRRRDLTAFRLGDLAATSRRDILLGAGLDTEVCEDNVAAEVERAAGFARERALEVAAVEERRFQPLVGPGDRLGEEAVDVEELCERTTKVGAIIVAELLEAFDRRLQRAEELGVRGRIVGVRTEEDARERLLLLDYPGYELA